MAGLTHLRDDFPILRREVNGHPLVYLDSAATTQKPAVVIEAINDYYRQSNASVHRGAYRLAQEATDLYEGARTRVAAFIGAAAAEELVFTRGATTSINFLAYGWGLHRLGEGDRILLTTMEHHANVVPWQMIARLTGAELVYLPITDEYLVDTDHVAAVVDDRVKIVAFSGMSNVLGTIGPIDALVAAARSVGAITIVDGAQMVPHLPVDVTAMGIDFMAFSAHKMLGPTGIGGLWGRMERLEELQPTEGGGAMIDDVSLYDATWAEIPHRFEAGTPPIAEAVGFGAAVDYLAAIGMDAVRKHEIEISRYALEQLGEVPGLTIYGPTDLERRGGVISFNLADIHPHDVATILDEQGVAVRAGHHCTRPLHRILEIPASTRASFYVYNTGDDVDRLLAALGEARRLFGVA
ncbi:MAG TPA: cysteine desulfurase [Acidimicrobiia bacterium]|nr:cysteine desulfurase [Acidimicrobiia bacterium]